MTVQTRIYSAVPQLIDTVSADTISIKMVSGSGLKYTKNGTDFLIDKIESDVSSGSEALVIRVTDGAGWHLENWARYKITKPTTDGGLRWQYGGGSVMTVTAWYPSRVDSLVEWELIDPDEPTVKLTVVVKRVP